MDSDLNIAVNADSELNLSETHPNGVSLLSQAKMNGQIAKLQAETNENKRLLSTGASRTTNTAPMTRNMHDYSDDEYEGPMRTQSESLDTNQLLTAID